MNGTEQIERILQEMDIAKLTKILSEAKTWIEQNPEQVRDQLRDSSQLAYALYKIPDILDQKIRDLETGVVSYAHNSYQNGSQYSNQQVYKNSQMQGVFLNFQEEQEEEQPPPQPQIPIQSPPAYEQPPPQQMYYQPQSNMYQYQQYPSYSQGNYQQDQMGYQAPQMSYSTDQSSQAYAPTYENGDAEFQQLVQLSLKMSQEEVDSLDDEDLKKQIMDIRQQYS